MLSPAFPLNALLDVWTGGSRRPVFFDIDEVAPGLRELDRAFSEIRKEVDPLLAMRSSLPRYHEVDPFQYRISGMRDLGKDWRVLMLYAMGERSEVNCDRIPRTAKLCASVPNLFQAFVSILDAGKSIPAHCGPYRGYLRYHLGIKVPRVNPPSMRVKDQHYVWQEGESVLFDDSWEHEVYNQSDDVRVILIVDILRPLPPIPHAINLAAQGVFRQIYARGILRLGT